MYVFDTYALIEWFAHHNKKYQKYFLELDEKGGFVTELILLEFYHRVFHERGEEMANKLWITLESKTETIKLNEDLIKKTGKKRSEMLKQKKNLSYADCLSLVVAEELGVKVLTSDKEFKDLKNAEFVER